MVLHYDDFEDDHHQYINYIIIYQFKQTIFDEHQVSLETTIKTKKFFVKYHYDEITDMILLLKLLNKIIKTYQMYIMRFYLD